MCVFVMGVDSRRQMAGKARQIGTCDELFSAARNIGIRNYFLLGIR